MANFDCFLMTPEQVAHKTLLLAWFKPNSSIGIVFPKHVQCKEFSHELWSQDATVPAWVKLTSMVRKNLGQTCYDNGSRIKLIHNSMHAKGVSFSMLYIHEQCMDDKELMYSLLPCLSSQNNLRYFK